MHTVTQPVKRNWCLQQLNTMTEVVAGVNGILAKLLFNAQQLVVLSQSLRAARSPSLDLTSPQAHHQVGNEGVLCLSRTVAHHDTPVIGLRQGTGLDGFSHGTDLVDLEQQRTAVLAINSLLNALGVGNGQVIANNLNINTAGQCRPSLPIILVVRVFNGDNGVVSNKALVKVCQLLTGQIILRLAIFTLEIQVVLAILAELRGSAIHGNLDLAGVASLFNGSNKEIQPFFVVLNGRSKASFVSNIASILAVLRLDDLLQMMVRLRTHSHGFCKAGRTGWQDHKLLHSQTVASVGAAVNDIEARHGQHQLLLVSMSSQVSNVTVQRDTLSSSCCFSSSH
eukprot:m.293218 g.293218  ORF g.293218 m.293218 type:complete len:339 (+) comp19454_c0_seq1:41-1057(+)